MHRWLVAGLLFCGAVHAGYVDTPSGSWGELRDKNLKMGFSVERVDRTLKACRTAGLSVPEAEDLLCPVYAAHAAELPADCVLLKIEEGLVKGAPWQDVHKAADRRLECMRRADGMIMAVRKRRGGEHQHLVKHTCMALESGLPEEVFEDIFSRPGRFRYGRLIHVVEAGESLQLAGLEPEQTLHIMHDCLDRDLTGAEISRVVNVIQNGLRDGKDFQTIHASLWLSANL